MKSRAVTGRAKYLENHTAQLRSKQKLLTLSDQRVNNEMITHV